MNDYLYNLILGIIRILIVYYLVFVLFPQKILKNEKSTQGSNDFLVNFVLAGGFSIVLISFLILINIYDTVSLILGYFLMALLLFISRKNWKILSILSGFNSFMLKKLETNSKLAIVYNFGVGKLRDRFSNILDFKSIWNVLLFVLIIITSYLRLKPAFLFASPFSIESYRTLEYVKYLQIKELFHDGSIVLKGLHGLLDMFFQFSRIDPEILVHTSGALMAALLTYIIYKIVYTLTKNHIAGILAASIFGIFPGLLPTNIQQQVEANSIILGTIFFIAVLVFVSTYLNKWDKKMFYAALAGIMGILLTNVFIASMLLVAAIPMLFTLFIFNNFRQRTKIFYVTIIASLVLLLGSFFGFIKIVDGNIILIENVKSFLTDDSFSRFALSEFLIPVELYSNLIVGIAVLLVMIGFINRRKYKGFFNTFLGLFLIVLTLLWNGEKFGLIQVFPNDQIAFLISVLLCISVGSLIDFFLFQLVTQNVKKIYQSEKAQLVYGLIILLVFAETLLFSRAVVVADFAYVTEPNGYVKSLHAIKNKYPAYQWTCVSHFGAKIQTKNYARYMDYLYFLKNYNPKTFNKTKQSSAPTAYLFIFVEKNKNINIVASELLPNVKNMTAKLQNWCSVYKKNHDDMSVFYEDDEVLVYKIISLMNKKNVYPNMFKEG
jgi:hypothetical protein